MVTPGGRMLTSDAVHTGAMPVALARVHRPLAARAQPERGEVAHRRGEDVVSLAVGRTEACCAVSQSGCQRRRLDLRRRRFPGC